MEKQSSSFAAFLEAYDDGMASAASGCYHSGGKLTRRKTEPVFSMQDMMRFARYMADGQRSEADLKRIFFHWTQDRFNWIEGS